MALPNLQLPKEKPRVTLTEFREHMKEQRRVVDAFQNVLARTGFGTSNLLEGTTYPFTRLTRNYILLQSLYRTNWIIRKVVDAVADDMMKNWITVVSQMPPKSIERFDKTIDETGTEEKLTSALKWARLFGGAGAVIIIEGDDNLEKPLDVEEVLPGTYRGLLVFDRWSGITPASDISNDIRRPLEFGLPESYQVTTETANSFKVHASRVLRFTGPGVPQWEWQAEQRWGISEVEVMYDELKKRDNTSWNIASLIFRANIFELKMKDLSQMLSGVGANAAVQQKMAAILQAQNQLMSNQGLFISDPEGGLSQHSYSFGGLSEVYVNFMLDVCGATGIPMSRLFGRSATGLGQTGEGDEHSYYDLIGQKQKRELSPQLRKLLPVIAMSTWGKVPKDFDWQYNPIRSLTNEEQSKLATEGARGIVETFNAGIIGRKTALSELRQLSEVTSAYSNVTQEMIEEADDEPMGGESMMGAGGEEPGEEDTGAPKETKDAATEVKDCHEVEFAQGAFAKMEEKHSHSEVQYAAHAKDERTTCSRCVHFIPSENGRSACAIVVNPIHAEGWCEEWSENAATEEINFQGLPVFTENRVGSVRRGDGWAVRMTFPYGYIKDTEGVDGDHVDCFIGPDPDATHAYVVHALNINTERFDEDKVMLGWSSAREAQQAFLANYSDPRFFGSMEKIPMTVFEEKLKQRGKVITGV